jgi:ankyrin repeat protein
MVFNVHEFTIYHSRYNSEIPLLIIVILNRRFDIAKILLTRGDNINKAGICMFASVLNKDLDMLIFMKYYGVNFNIKNDSGMPLLNFIVKHNWIDGLKYLLL